MEDIKFDKNKTIASSAETIDGKIVKTMKSVKTGEVLFIKIGYDDWKKPRT